MKRNLIKAIYALVTLLVSIHADAGGRLRYLCTDEAGNKYFTQKASQNCLMNTLGDGWVNVSMAPNIVADVMPNTIVREQDGAKAWTQFFLTSPVPSNDGRWSYDYVKGVSKFYCGKRQSSLIQATYVLDGKRVSERSSAESIVEEIEPGTVSDDIYKFVCKK